MGLFNLRERFLERRVLVCNGRGVSFLGLTRVGQLVSSTITVGRSSDNLAPSL